MPRIKLSQKMNDASKLAAVDTSGYKEMYLNVDSIIPAEENFYPLDEIEELADDLLDRGQLQPLLIARVDGEYKLAVGHRRREAIIFNNKRGHVHKAWCFAKEMDYTEFMLTLISANAYTRKMDDATLLEQAEKLNYWTQVAIREGKLELHGATRDYVAKKLQISSTKMAQVNQVNAHLSEDGKQALKSGKMNFTKAYETSKLPLEKQSAVIQDESLLSADVKNMVQKEKDVSINFSAVAVDEPCEEVDFQQPEVTVNIAISPEEGRDVETKESDDITGVNEDAVLVVFREVVEEIEKRIHRQSSILAGINNEKKKERLVEGMSRYEYVKCIETYQQAKLIVEQVVEKYQESRGVQIEKNLN